MFSNSVIFITNIYGKGSLLKYLPENGSTFEYIRTFFKFLEYYSNMRLDTKDLAILKILENNAKKTTQQISREIGVPITTIHNRIKKLESSGIIEKYTVWINWKKLGRGINARLAITVGRDGDQDEICAKLVHHDAVFGAYQVTGDEDIIVKLKVKDIDELHDFIMNEVRTIKGVEGTKTLIVLKYFKK